MRECFPCGGQSLVARTLVVVNPTGPRAKNHLTILFALSHPPEPGIVQKQRL